MDARLIRLALLVPAFVCSGTLSSLGATFSTSNFVVTAPTAEFAKSVAETAERCRGELAEAWLGRPLPRWFRPCQVAVTVGQLGAGGATTFTFAAGQVFGWNMKVQGTPERILDSVIPHEVSHTIFASYFRRPLPRWADEGAATLVEHESERRRQQILLKQVFHSDRRIPLTRLISMKEYPSDMSSVLTLYAQGYSLADYLVQSGGRERYLAFLKDAHEYDWNHAIRTYYGLPDVITLERRWSDWVMADSPEIGAPNDRMIAASDARARGKNVVVRSQSPENDVSSRMERHAPAPARATKPIPRGDDMRAPEPADRGRPSVRATGLPPNDAQSASSQSRRREGRERVISEGWQAAADGGPNSARPERMADRHALSADASAGESPAAESSARRRFRDAKRRQEEATDERLRQADPFEEEPADAPAGNRAEAQSYFHTEN